MNRTIQRDGSFGILSNCSSWSIQGCDLTRYDFLSTWSRLLFFSTIPAAAFGLVGNLLTIWVRRQATMRSSVNSLLLALATADAGTILFVSISAIPELQDAGYRSRSLLAAYCTKIVYPLAVTFLTASIYTLVLITIERYIAVCFPFAARRVCTQRKAVLGIVVVALASFLFNFPRFFETAISYSTQLGNVTVTMRGVPVAVTVFGPLYRRIYTMWSYLIVVYVVPFIMLVVFNLKIIFSLRKSTQTRRRLSKKEATGDPSTTLMLLLIIFLFLLCALPGFALRLLELNYYEKRRSILDSKDNEEFEKMFFDQLRLRPLIVFLGSLATFLVVVNAGINIIIYCKFSESFRKGLKCLFGKKKPQTQSANSLTESARSNGFTGPNRIRYHHLCQTTSLNVHLPTREHHFLTSQPL